MAVAQTQISAYISEETRALLDQTTEARGLKKGHVIEEALLDYLRALRELPSDVLLPGRLVLSEASAQQVQDRLSAPEAPTQAMRALMAGQDGDDVPT